jgi:hypothetical protein
MRILEIAVAVIVANVYGVLSGARNYSKHFTDVNSFNLHDDLGSECCVYPLLQKETLDWLSGSSSRAPA